MKRIITALILLLSISSLFAVNLDVTVTSGNFELYDAYGRRCDGVAVSDLEGLIVLTNEEEVTFSTDYGDIILGGNSIFSVLSLDASAPTFYLIDGKAGFDLREDIYIQVYTPVTLTALNESGVYEIITTDDEEAIYNYSTDSYARSLDGLSGISYEIYPQTYSSLTRMVVNIPLDQVDTLPPEQETKEMSVEEIVEEVVEDVIRPKEPTIISVEGKLNIPSKPELVVSETYLPPVPKVPEVVVKGYEYSIPSPASLSITKHELTGFAVPSIPSIEVERKVEGVPAKPDFTSVTYESNLIAPAVSVFEVEKKTLTE